MQRRCKKFDSLPVRNLKQILRQELEKNSIFTHSDLKLGLPGAYCTARELKPFIEEKSADENVNPVF